MAREDFHDALVVGTGFGGLYQLYLLKQLGLNVKAIDGAGDVGGTWYWNRYPGARSDVESHVYRYSWDKELLQTYPWPENYLTQPEVLKYFQTVARKHDLYRHIQFETELQGATWEDERNLWRIHLSTGEVFRVRYIVTAVGILHRTHLPDIPGLGNFKGQIAHSAAWTPDLQYENRRVGVIGSGASGVQLVSSLGEKAQTLTHFIRHAQYVLPANLRTVSPEERKVVNDQYDYIWNQVFTSSFGFGFPEPARTTFSVSPEDRETVFQDLWKQGSGFRFLSGGFSDLAINADANREAIKFIHRKIREIVKDQKTAEILSSTDFFARRPLTDDKYYYRFNQDNISAVDLKETPITSVEPDGVKTADGTVHPLDLIVFATGFDAVDGSYLRIDFKGRGGQPLKEHWAEGPKSHLGATTSGFPNLFFVNGPGTAYANNVPIAEINARFATELIAHSEDLRKNGKGSGVVESTKEAEDGWQTVINNVADATLFSKTPSWFFGENIPGKKKSARFYLGGIATFRAALADSKSKGYSGFRFE